MEQSRDDCAVRDSSIDQPGTATGVRESAPATADEHGQESHSVKEQVTDASRRATAKIDAQRGPAARALDNTAGRLRERSADLTSATSRAAQVTADKLQATAHYLRENDVRAMMDDVEDVVRQHPGPALAAAAVVGFLVGRALRRSD